MGCGWKGRGGDFGRKVGTSSPSIPAYAPVRCCSQTISLHPTPSCAGTFIVFQLDIGFSRWPNIVHDGPAWGMPNNVSSLMVRMF